MIGYMRNDINVDGGCFVGKNDSRKLPYPCMLCAICLETLEEIYPRTLEEQFACQNGISEKEAKKVAEEYYSNGKQLKIRFTEYEKTSEKRFPAAESIRRAFRRK